MRPADRQRDLRLRRKRRFADQQHGAKRTRSVVHLRLWEIQRILTFDIARAHIVANRVADNLRARVDTHRELRFGDDPLRVTTYSNSLSRSAHTPRRRLEKQLRTLRAVDAIVETAAT